MSETARIRHIYDERAATYDRSLGVVEKLVLGGLRREYGALLRGTTLEVGIGSGLNLPFYSPDVARIIGADLSGEMLRQARAKATRLGLPALFVQADAAQLPFADAMFDTVAISLALCTIPDPVAALRELARVCKPDGRVVLLEHVRSTARPIAALQRIVTPMNERAIGCHLDRATLDSARSLGFVVDERRSQLFGAVRLAVARPPATGRATLGTG